MSNSLQSWSGVLEAGRKQEEAKRLAWQEEIGPPAFIFEDQFGERGFWPDAQDGVWVIPKKANGYHPHEAAHYSSEFIAALNRALPVAEGDVQ